MRYAMIGTTTVIAITGISSIDNRTNAIVAIRTDVIIVTMDLELSVEAILLNVCFQ